MQAGSRALGTPTGYLAHGTVPPHIGANGRHGGTATAWILAKSAIFAAQIIRVNPCYGIPLIAFLSFIYSACVGRQF